MLLENPYFSFVSQPPIYLTPKGSHLYLPLAEHVKSLLYCTSVCGVECCRIFLEDVPMQAFINARVRGRQTLMDQVDVWFSCLPELTPFLK